MTDLDDDIARVAALRGRGAETQALQDRQAHLKRRVAWSEIDDVLKAPADPHADMLAYDELPQALRDCFREAPTLKPINAVAALRLVEAGREVDSIIEAVQHRLNAT